MSIVKNFKNLQMKLLIGTRTKHEVIIHVLQWIAIVDCSLKSLIKNILRSLNHAQLYEKLNKGSRDC
jgi:hypothetical protein